MSTTLSFLIITHEVIIPWHAQHLTYTNPYLNRKKTRAHTSTHAKVNYEIGVKRIDESLGGIPGGTSLLVKDGSFSGKDKLLNEAILEGFENGEGTVYVTTDDPSEDVLKEFPEDESFGVVDCVTEVQSAEEPEETDTVRYASSPSDMTGIGVKVTDLLGGFRDERGIEHNRVLLDSVSTLLMYSNLETVFRFLHVFTGRVRSIDGLGVFVVDAGAHDDEEYTTLRQLFDGVVEVEDDEGLRARVVGLTDEPTEWVRLD